VDFSGHPRILTAAAAAAIASLAAAGPSRSPSKMAEESDDDATEEGKWGANACVFVVDQMEGGAVAPAEAPQMFRGAEERPVASEPPPNSGSVAAPRLGTPVAPRRTSVVDGVRSIFSRMGVTSSAEGAVAASEGKKQRK
jgi:hypothetical protein